ncbi:hypothetical protein [Halorientalis halophila]|uniref:hypothetical protein n=1 Tax=Halorientalis halophila TaxID=3108499 RepID=UPI003009347E
MATEPVRSARLALALGYLAFGAAALAAWTDPGRRYELDVYAATPTAFWAGLGLAVVLALFVAYNPAVTRGVRTGALVLLGTSVLAVAGLPILRNYYFWGVGDSLSHLGFARLLASDRLSPFGFLYPGIHSIAVFTSRTLGVPLTRAMLYVVVAFTALFVAFTALSVRAIADSRWALPTGVVAGAFLLPINNVSVFLEPYPTSQAIFFVPFIVYLAIRYLDLPDSGFPRAVTGVGLLLGLASVTVVLLHPQQAGSVLLLFGAIVAVQWLFRRWVPDHAISRQRPFYAPMFLATAAFLLWAPRFERFYGATSGLISGLLGVEPVGNEVTSRASSLDILGGSVVELFAKLFGVSLLLSIVAGFVVLAGWLGRLDDPARRGTLLRYLAGGLALLSGTFLVFFAASISVLPFRYLGAAMVVVTILAAVGLVDGVPLSIPWPSWRTMRFAAVLLFTGLLAAQAAHVHGSPYIFQPSDQVTETSMHGYQNSFEHRDPAVEYAGIRGGPRRFVDATYGTTFTDRTPGGKLFEGKEEGIPGPVFNSNLSTHYERDRYLPVTDRNRVQEVALYDGFRYSLSGFRGLRTTPGIHRVRSNGDFRLYYVD